MINSELQNQAIDQFKQEIASCPVSIKEMTLKDFRQKKIDLEKDHAAGTYSKMFTMKSLQMKQMPPEEYAIWYLDYLAHCISHLETEGIVCPS